MLLNLSKRVYTFTGVSEAKQKRVRLVILETEVVILVLSQVYIWVKLIICVRINYRRCYC